ncbi:MAG: hypothetical protein LBN97_10155 [Oscillospiraceae bacterium]|nr:hypothetical protein [Oscillospiraceae bacterium]
MNDIFKTITDAESEAKRIRAEADRQAAEALQKAKTDGEAKVETARSAARTEAAEALEKARAAAAKEAESLASTIENRKAVIRADSSKRYEKAADFIVERIVNA